MEAFWTNKDSSIGSLEDDVELKREARTDTVQIVDVVLANTEGRVRSWAKLKRIVGVWVVAQEKLHESFNKGNSTQNEDQNRTVHCDKDQLEMVLNQRA